MNVNTVRLPIDPGTPLDSNTISEAGWTTLNQLYKNNIMVVMTVDDGVSDQARITAAVNFYKNHPAVLMFSLGSEWNINWYFGKVTTQLSAAQLTQSAAQLVKSLDNSHPVSTIYGDLEGSQSLAVTQNYIATVCSSVDVWGLNVYRGDNFGTLFSQWASITTKPMFAAEFGADAFHTSNPNASPPVGEVNEAEQASWDLSLWNDVLRSSSALNSKNVAIGGTVFEFQDELWKCSPGSSQSTCGFLSGGFPDGFSNEAYFGVADISRRPRQAYSTLRIAYDPQYKITQQIVFSATSEGSTVPDPLHQLGYAELRKGTVVVDRAGLTLSRGFNIAAFSGVTGDLLSFPSSVVNFDTWGTRDTGTAMEKMVVFLNGLPNGTIILIVVEDEAGLDSFPPTYRACSSRLTYPWVQDGLQALYALGARKLSSYCYQNSWSMIAVKGEGVARDEQLSADKVVTAQATFTLNFGQIQAANQLAVDQDSLQAQSQELSRTTTQAAASDPGKAEPRVSLVPTSGLSTVELQLSSSARTREVHMRVGQTMITNSEREGTRYVYDAEGTDDKILQTDKSDYANSGNKSNPATYIFKAVSPGETSLSFSPALPLERDPSLSQKLTIVVHVDSTL